MADAGVQGVAGELDAAGLEGRAGGGDILDMQGDRVAVRREVEAELLRDDDGERDRVRLELREVAVRVVDRALQAEGVAIERDGAVEVLGGDRDEVDPGDDLGGGSHTITLDAAPSRPER